MTIPTNVLPLLLVAAICIAASGPAGAQSTSELSERQLGSAREIADEAIGFRTLLEAGPIYFVHAERLREKDDAGNEAPGMRVEVFYYKYEGDVTIRALVDLESQALVGSTETAHLPVPLAFEERRKAEELALANEAVAAAVADHRDQLTVEAMVVRMTEDDPLFGHRVVALLFRVGSGYLTKPRVLVDLTTEEVIVEADSGGLV